MTKFTNHIKITLENGQVEDHITNLAFMEFIGGYNLIDENNILQEMFEQRFIQDKVTDRNVTWYHDGKTLCQKTDIGRVRRYDLVNF